MAETARGRVDHAERATLKLLALAGALDGESKVSCASLAQKLDASNQTASRRLQRLEDARLIEREIVSDGQWITITDAGEGLLQEAYAEYQRIFEHEIGVTLTGAVTSGMGEGRHYISLPGYMEQFEAKLGYEPFAGTFNVNLDDQSVRARARMNALDPIVIEGWESEDRTYGPAFCYPASLETSDGEYYRNAHVISPERTHHDNAQLEIISPDRLRETLALEDGDSLTIHVYE
jgi:riboflavin kinase